MAAIYLLVLLASAAFTFAEVVNIQNCSEDVDSCIVHEARIDPCPEAANNRACHVHRRRKASMSFDYTPSFDSDTLEAGLTWVKDDGQELPLITLDRDACKYTTCPVKANVKQTYTIEVPVESKFPTNSYTIKWVLKASNNQKCCFTTDIKVVR